MKKNVLIIGAGGVAKVVAHKCAQHNDELGRIAIASRNISKCQAIIDSVKAKGSLKVPADIQAFALNALDVEATKALIRETESQIVINVGSAFLNMSVLRACIDTGVAYLATTLATPPAPMIRTFFFNCFISPLSASLRK
ncbi:saccharopine dehydrogenase NADP-binding domain-containing protein, partial [Pseudomonas edaphica]|uniref:saccharopine dehydrogenase NADP-binding domain-containing protein n=1 Tax=Pseudomonas edaphica TaxID=2006980 RepID=UPI001F3373AE